MVTLIDGGSVLEAYLATLVDRSVRARGVPETLAQAACEATLRNLSPSRGQSAHEIRARTRAYFNATVRRMSARSSAPEVIAYRRRVIAKLIAEDLKCGGVSAMRIASEVEEWACGRASA
ncbi:MAG: hypothetical protein KGZ40_07075 [Clostridiales bacterium]|nr:hypothetical protein [Clostridiales bacterium]